MTKPSIGFIGLGIMGRPQALNLIKAGYPLTVWARRAEALTPLQAAGAQTASSPAELTTRCSVIFLSVSDTPDVEEILFGPQGITTQAPAGTVIVDMSTISPTTTREMAIRLAEHGIDMVDAPVSGGETGAIQGTLSIMVGGAPHVIDTIQPMLACMGNNIVHCGDNGAGQVAKACNQIVVALTIQAVAEALTFAKQHNTDPAKVRAALLGGFAASRILEVHGQRMLDQQFAPGFKAKLHRKDIDIVMKCADTKGLQLPATALVQTLMSRLVDDGNGELDSSALIKLLS